MKIFLGAELEGAAGNKWFVLQKEFNKKLLSLDNKNYGDELIHIGIISIIMREEFFVDGAYKERRHINRKTKTTDIRLRIDYNKFVKSSNETRRQLYIEHITEAIRISGEKAGKTFETERLIEDVLVLLNENQNQSEDGSLSYVNSWVK